MERARAVDTAWISTIHRFCLRILRAHAFDAGLDPRFTVADDVGARMLLHEAFDMALERFLAEGPDRRARPARHLWTPPAAPMMLDALARLRSAGRPLDLRPAERRDLAPAQIAARAAATALAGAEKPDALTALLDTGPAAAELTDLSAQRLRKAAANQDYNDALAELEQAARDAAASADLGPARAAALGSSTRLPRAQGRPQPGRLHRPRAAGPRAPVRAAGPGRGLSGAVRRRDRGRVPGHEPAAVRADRPGGGRRALPRRRRVPEHLPVPPRRRRGVPPAAGGGRRRGDRAVAATTARGRT